MPEIFHMHQMGADDGSHHSNVGDHHFASEHHLTDPSEMDHTNILGSHTDVPWLHFGPHAPHHDADHDGIPDTLDHVVGPGAEPQMLGAHADVPWLNFGPHAMHYDTDGDGIPDALDHHVGPGAETVSPGSLSSGVPWQQLTPEAMHHDTDGDGITDALDNHVGPGAEQDTW